jgi:hypothetical protein
MPKAAMHEGGDTVAGENQIRASWQASAMKAISKSGTVD